MRRTTARVVVQVLRKLAPADARQPVADIIIVRLLIGRTAVKAFCLQLIRITCQRNFGIAVQLISITFIYIKLRQQPFETDFDSESRLLA